MVTAAATTATTASWTHNNQHTHEKCPQHMSHLPHELAYLIYHEAPPGDIGHGYSATVWLCRASYELVQGSTGRSFHLVQDLIVAAGRRRRTLIIRSTCDGHFVYHNAILICRKGCGCGWRRGRQQCVSHVTGAYVNRRGDARSTLFPLVCRLN